MKRFFILISIFSGAVLLIASSRSSRTDAGDNPAVEQSLLQMERDWADAVMKNNAPGIDQIEADDYSYFMDEMAGNKQSDLASAKSSELSGTAELTDLKARVFGDAAVVTGKTALHDAAYKGKDISGSYLFTDVFVKRNGKWQVVASHSNKVRGV